MDNATTRLRSGYTLAEAYRLLRGRSAPSHLAAEESDLPQKETRQTRRPTGFASETDGPRRCA
jgi:hypothetical protein